MNIGSDLLFLFIFCSGFSFSFSSRWHCSARKGPYALRPVSQQSPQGCPRNSANICLVEHRSFSAFEGGMSAASFLHSSFLQAVNAVMLWLVRAEKVPQASEHLCPAKLQTRCDICCACQSICPFIPTDSGVEEAVVMSQQSLSIGNAPSPKLEYDDILDSTYVRGHARLSTDAITERRRLKTNKSNKHKQTIKTRPGTIGCRCKSAMDDCVHPCK